mmetsp:Transcript_61901/g.144060  ORF Transcript_61901/g.144060 Transcript_61901/m.144060 type:complete len:329 (-) Transcript_61901:109-1095(-)
MDSLWESETVVSIVELIVFAEPSILDIDHIECAVLRIALMSRRIEDWLGQDPFFKSFMERARGVIQRSTPRPKWVATLFWSISQVKEPLPELQEVFEDLTALVPAIVADMDLRNLTSCFLSVAKLHRVAPEVRSAADPLLNEILRRADELEPRHVASSIWAAGELASVSEQAASVPNVLLAGRDLELFDSPTFSRMLWGLANLDWRGEMVLFKVLQILRERVPNMTRKEVRVDLPMCLCALARLQCDDAELITAAAPVLMMRKVLKSMKDWGIAALAWSWPDARDGNLFGVVARVRDVLNSQMTKRKLTPADLERAPLGPVAWGARDT